MNTARPHPRSRTLRSCTAIASGALALASALSLSPRRALAQGATGSTPVPAAEAPPPIGKARLTEAQRRDAAKETYKEAEGRFEIGDYAGALPLYQQAYLLIPGAILRYKVAISLDRLGRVKESTAAYELFLAGKPDPDAFKDKIAEVTGRITLLKASPAKLTIATNPAAVPDLKLAVDEAQATNELSLPPGKHTITATATGWKGSLPIELTYGEVKEVTVQLIQEAVPEPPKPPVVIKVEPPPPPPPPPPRRSNVPAYALLGLAGIGGVAGTIFGVQSLGSKSAYVTAPSLQGLLTAERQARLSDLCYAGAIILGAVGGALVVGNLEQAPPKTVDKKPAAATAEIAPYFSPYGGGAAATLRF